MLTNVNHIKGLVIRATDGEIGTVDQLYFDDETWAIRYLTVATGGWLSDREVLISPFSVTHVDWQSKRLDVALTKKQIENSPNRDTQRPVSRQYESEYLGYYNYPDVYKRQPLARRSLQNSHFTIFGLKPSQVNFGTLKGQAISQ